MARRSNPAGQAVMDAQAMGPLERRMEGMTKRRSKARTEQQGPAELKKRLVEASWILAMEGHGDLVWGHASVRTPGSDTFWIKPTGMGLDEVRVEDLLLCNLDGEVVQGKGPRHIEVYI